MAGAYYSPDAVEPGADWRLLVSDRFVGAFGPGTPAATMSGLWRIAADPSLGLETLVAAIPMRGAGAVDAFAVAAVGRITTFVVRGAACADVSVAGRIRRVDARGSEPWYVAELASVERFALGPLQRSPGDLRPASRDLPVDRGVVVGPWLGWAADLAVRGTPPSAPAPVPSAERWPRSAPVPVQAAGAPHAPTTGLRPRNRTPAAQAAPTPAPTTGWPQTTSPRPQWSPAGPPPVANPQDTNVLGDLGRRAASLRRHRGEPPATAPTPETEVAAAFRVGDRPPERVDAPVYVGRQPRSPRVTGPMLPRLVRVDSPSREVSATHIELRPTDAGLVLTDMESTNGTVVREPGSGVRRLESGESLPVVPGTLIDIGDGNVIEILAYR